MYCYMYIELHCSFVWCTLACFILCSCHVLVVITTLHLTLAIPLKWPCMQEAGLVHSLCVWSTHQQNFCVPCRNTEFHVFENYSEIFTSAASLSKLILLWWTPLVTGVVILQNYWSWIYSHSTVQLVTALLSAHVESHSIIC